MNREEFIKRKEENLNIYMPIWFDDSRGYGDGYCVRKDYKLGWEVFYRERGNESDFAEFYTESEALDYLYQKLLKTQKSINVSKKKSPLSGT